MPVSLQAGHRDPLQRRPAIGLIPLFAALDQCGPQPARGQKLRLDDLGGGIRLRLIGDARQKRGQRRRGDLRAERIGGQIIVGETAFLRIPQMPVHCGAPRFGKARIGFPIGIARGDRKLQAIKEGVQVDRGDAGRADR